ncbi:MAG: glycerol-3-phosphate 1-O-acyltransferase PlsY [Elusimicrobia bacterium]|nr:glycerol-3-phosphate 1-O-acyltransferase PlsY [Elusimicrobiota bacterium]
MIYIVLVLSFLIGSIPTGYLISKTFYGIDIRQHGSGNTGATNVGRILGKKPAIITFLTDTLKGFLPVLLSKKLFPDTSIIVPVIAAFLAVAGNMWTPFLKFKGGKGVATGCGVFLGLAPAATGFSLVIFIITLAITKYVSISSITAAVSLPVFLYILDKQELLIYISLLLAVMIIWRHKSNIKKLLDKTEQKIR